MGAVRSSEALVNFCRTTWPHIPEDSRTTLHSHSRESLKYRTVLMHLNPRHCVDMRGMRHALAALIPGKASLTNYPFYRKLRGLHSPPGGENTEKIIWYRIESYLLIQPVTYSLYSLSYQVTSLPSQLENIVRVPRSLAA